MPDEPESHEIDSLQMAQSMTNENGDVTIMGMTWREGMEGRK